MVTHQLQVKRRPVKGRRSKTDVLPLSYTDQLNVVVELAAIYSCQFLDRNDLWQATTSKKVNSALQRGDEITWLHGKICSTLTVTDQPQRIIYTDVSRHYHSALISVIHALTRNPCTNLSLRLLIPTRTRPESYELNCETIRNYRSTRSPNTNPNPNTNLDLWPNIH